MPFPARIGKPRFPVPAGQDITRFVRGRGFRNRAAAAHGLGFRGGRPAVDRKANGVVCAPATGGVCTAA